MENTCLNHHTLNSNPVELIGISNQRYESGLGSHRTQQKSWEQEVFTFMWAGTDGLIGSLGNKVRPNRTNQVC